MLRISAFVILCLLSIESWGQFNGRFIIGCDLYQWYRNPQNNSSELGGSSGGIFPLVLGTEFMAGKGNYSFGIQTNANLGIFNFDTDYKGLGAVAFPFIAKVNYGCLSGFSSKMIGFSVGGGIQYQRTELFGLSSKFDQYEREFFPTYIGQIEIAGGLGGLNISYYLRMGLNQELKEAFSFNSGVLFSLNYYKRVVEDKKISNPLKS
ncbi:MAG: hypothetical protein HOP11_04810 [Saprospiraceae bacterium]|nr:hypothetical protein [Saprospiraceae bacterium]